MTLAPGTRLGPYEVLAPVGVGGMGEVYRAKDTRLERVIALKVLPEELFEERERRERFEREAKLLAALNHPNIAAIYSFEETPASPGSAGRHLLVMELLEGETLRHRLDEGPIPQRKAFEYGLQIAQGLAAAHEKGIVHRDLKPENIFATSEGRLKILDFGLAKVASSAAGGTQTPTLTATEPGTVMGTVGYMSPEQVRGKPADRRSDIFSFGSILYEMLSGERAFRGDSAAETMAAIAQKDPPELAQPSGRFPPAVERVLRHCLEKRPEDRFDTARDLAFALETAMGGQSAPSVASTERAPRKVLPAALASIAIVVALGAGLFLGDRIRPRSVPRIRQITYHRGIIEDARFTPDGQTVVFGSTRRDEPLRTYVTRLDSIESRTLDLPPGATVLGISRTGEMALLLGCVHRGYWMRSGTLARVALGGGAPREILEHVADADISPDGKDFAAVREAGKLRRLEFPIGKPVLETDGWVSHLRISPDGTRLAFLDHPVYGNDSGYVSLASPGGPVVRLTGEWAGAQGLAWSRDGEEIWFTASLEETEGVANGGRHQLWSIRPGGKPRLVYGPPMDLNLRDISSTGAVLLSGEDRRGEVGGLLRGETRERDLSTWKDEAVNGISEDGSIYTGIEQSAPGAGLEPFFYYRRVGESAPVRLGGGTSVGISPDGRWILRRTVSDKGSASLTLIPTGPGDPRPLPIGNVRPRAVLHERAHWSLDGRRILFSGAEPDHPARTFVLDLAGGPPRPATPEGSSLAVLSPDGGSVAAVDAAGRI
ncbi:MAG TPA: WD40 repeat domain-containing serine/threonine protein kinase, partial [Thermoanaerobaculia bacterium]|nr:WD40 repeat domain-containing serine/threonine protein kinase [Thermoanaerobaculia bacterium]